MNERYRVVRVPKPPDECQDPACRAPRSFLSPETYDGGPVLICDRCSLIHQLPHPKQ